MGAGAVLTQLRHTGALLSAKYYLCNKHILIIFSVRNQPQALGSTYLASGGLSRYSPISTIFRREIYTLKLLFVQCFIPIYIL